MNIIEPYYEIIPNPINGSIDIKRLEKIARICYKSENKISPDSGERILRALFKNKHMAMLEHQWLVFIATNEIIHIPIPATKIADNGYSVLYNKNPRLTTFMSDKNDVLMAGNLRSWYEAVEICDYININFYNLLCSLPDPIGEMFEKIDITGKTIDKKSIDVALTSTERYDEKISKEQEEYMRPILMHTVPRTVKFVCDRGVSHELVRHRDASFAQESTRYCNYTQEKNGDGITVIKPCYFEKGSKKWDEWYESCIAADRAYSSLISCGCKPEEARSVLPTSVKTEIVVTATLAEWQHIFDLRAKQVTGKAHPQMLELMVPLWDDFKKIKIGEIQLIN